MKYLNHLLAGTFALALSACGGSGDSGSSTPPAPTYSGITTPVAITATNAQGLSTKSTDATEEAITQQTASENNPYNPLAITITTANTDINPLITRITREIVSHNQAASNLPTGATITAAQLGAPFCGGSISYPDSFGNNGMLNGTITYNNLCYNDTFTGVITVNGSITFTETSTTITIRYINFTITGAGLSETVNMTVSCDTDPMTSFFINCSISADFTGSDGKVYRIADMSVSGFGTGPYYISATFYHPDYGYVILSTIGGLYYECSNGYPSAGTISIAGSGTSSASITFTSCDGYTGTWNDGNASSGSFSGTWL